MNVTIVSDVLGSENNGTTIATMNLARYLMSKGHNIKFLCADQSKKGLDNYYVVPNLNVGPFNSIVKKNGVVLANPKTDIVIDSIKDADLVHIMIPLGLGMRACKEAYKLNKPITAGFHMQAQNLSSQVHMQNNKLFNKIVYKVIYKKLFSKLDATHYPTKFIKDTFEANINKETKGYIISNGVNPYVCKKEVEKPEEFKDKIVILTIGRYTREKDQKTLLKAIKYSKYKDKIQLILAGQGPLFKKYKKISKKYKNKPILKFLGRDEIVDIINYCDIYVHPALMELEGIACLEAMCCGKLTLVSDSKLSATKEFAATNDCIFRGKNPKDLASKIDFFIDNPEIKEECERIYLERKEKYNQDVCMQNMEKMFEEVIKNHIN